MKNPFSKIFNNPARRTPETAQLPALKPAPPTHEPRNQVVIWEEPGSDKVVLKDLVLLAPEGDPLIEYGTFTLSPGDRMMLSGPAGCGKSAGLAALRNAWLLGGSGEIAVPPEVRFVPQEDYFPDRTLQGIICAPDPVTRFTCEQAAQALTDAGLGDFIAEMDDPTKRGEYWRNTLSGGQKNKIGFAGIFLHAAETRVLIVDEITAALDTKAEGELYSRLLDRMRHGIVISVAHHSTLASRHNVLAKVAGGKVCYTKTPPEVAAPAAPKEPPAPFLRAPKSVALK